MVAWRDMAALVGAVEVAAPAAIAAAAATQCASTNGERVVGTISFSLTLTHTHTHTQQSCHAPQLGADGEGGGVVTLVLHLEVTLRARCGHTTYDFVRARCGNGHAFTISDVAQSTNVATLRRWLFTAPDDAMNCG